MGDALPGSTGKEESASFTGPRLLNRTWFDSPGEPLFSGVYG